MNLFLHYAISRYQHEQTDMAYRVYMTDTLFYHNQQKALSTRFYDMIHKPVEDDEKADDIVADILTRAGLRFKE